MAGAVAAATGAWSASAAVGMLVGLLAGLAVRSFDLDATAWMVVVVMAVGVTAGLRGATELRMLEPRLVGPYQGWAQVVGEPRPTSTGIRVVLRVEGQRYEVWSRAGDHRSGVPAGVQMPASERMEVLAGLRGGQRIHVTGELRPLSARRAPQVVSQHVVGTLRIDELGPVAPASRIGAASNAVRRAVERGSAQLRPPHDALFRGFVIGDRSGQTDEVRDRFRATGLSHLTVVSGLNVALVLAVVGPLVRRLGPWARWLATLLVIVWFASLTRFEPSVVRAAAMAALAATAFVLGRDRTPFRLLGLAVAGLLVVDPLLVRSAGFWLSVGATAGVCTAGPWLAARLAVLGPAASPVGITLGAELGVFVPLVVTFGHVPFVSVFANTLAVPVASVVKLYGLPASIVAGWVSPLAGPLMAPCRFGVVWVDRVAITAERLEPTGAAAWLAWALLLVVLVVLLAWPGRRRDRI